MEKWENLLLDQYELKERTEKEIQGQYDKTKALNVLGQEGWELVDVLPKNSREFYFFKRPTQKSLQSKIELKDQDKEVNQSALRVQEDGLLDALVKGETITPEERRQALDFQKERNLPIEKVLIELGFLKENEVNEFLRMYFGVPIIKLSEFILERKTLNLLEDEFCKALELIPVSLAENILTIAMTHPEIAMITNYLRLRFKDKEIRVVYASQDDIQKAIKMYYVG